jgi:predicted aminopeptidase
LALKKYFSKLWLFVRKRKLLSSVILGLILVLTVSGCSAVKFYSQAVRGQLQIFHNERPIKEVIADTNTTAKLKGKLELILKAREFAERELSLPADGNYLLYADLHREHVVWNVHAAPEFSLVAKSWWYPFAGRATYRGYFSEQNAKQFAAKLEKQNLDVYYEGIDAYSTLGWFKEPILNTFVYESDTDLAETIFHELAHQRVYVGGDTAFNEAFAVSVEREGIRRWLGATNHEAWDKFKVRKERREQFVQLILETRKKLATVYDDLNLSVDTKRQRKKEVIDELRANYAKMKKEKWGGYKGYDEWFDGPLNNAQLNTISTYFHLVPAFEKLLQQNDSDMPKYYEAVKALSKLSKDERHAKLEALFKEL